MLLIGKSSLINVDFFSQCCCIYPSHYPAFFNKFLNLKWRCDKLPFITKALTLRLVNPQRASLKAISKK